MEKLIEKTAIDIGSAMIENGAEINRVEDTIERILRSKGIENANIFCISSMIIISTDTTVEVKRIRRNDLNLFVIDELNAKSRAICGNYEYIEKSNHYPIIIKLLSIILATGSFCIYFGGNLYDALLSGLIGIIITYKKSIIKGEFSHTLCDSAIAGILSYIPSLFTAATHPDKIMIGTIMLLIPGLTIGNAMRDIMNSDILSGIIELISAIFTALAIALGFAVAVVIFR
ncbi:MAG: threonine/serine exporter ThrE family protein [Eubacterium sp.]